MKRFGLSVLLSAIYVGTLIFVFSTDFSKQNSFLFSEPVQEKGVVATPELMPVETPETADFIQLEVDEPEAAEATPEIVPGDSPESAAQ